MFHRSFCAGIAVVLLGGSTLTAAASPSPSSRVATHLAHKPKQQPPKALDAHARARLAVSRFTFGPRPGEVEQVQAEGLDRWFEQQLHPGSIDDAALAQRLAMYPALAMTPAQRLARYPDPATIRRIAKSGGPPPGAEEQVILRDQVEFYQARQQARADAGAASANGAAAPAFPTDQTVSAMPQQDVDRLLAMPAGARYQATLALPVEQLMALRKGLRQRGGEQKFAEGMTPLQMETLLALGGTNRMLTSELRGARLLRDVYSQRELEAVMTDFWLNHFNIDAGKNGEEPSFLPEFEEAVRTHALGRFEDLLVATAESPAMLLYLDNAASTGPGSPAGLRAGKNGGAARAGLNENYARELMELHTLGVNGGYTQKDVTEVARVLTGWSIQRPGDAHANGTAAPGEFVFQPRRHDPGDKQVLGETIHESGQSEGLELLHILASSPATAHFLSLELAERFVSDEPPPAMVDRMAAAYLRSDGDIATVLRTMFHSPEFWTSATANGKWKTPVEFVASAARASDAEVSNPEPMVQALARLGMPLYGCQPPTGYHWDEATWLSSGSLVGRMKFAVVLAQGRLPGTQVNLPHMGSDDSMAVERALERALLDGGASAETRATVLQAGAGGGAPLYTPVAGGAAKQDSAAVRMTALLLGSPEFQRR